MASTILWTAKNLIFCNDSKSFISQAGSCRSSCNKAKGTMWLMLTLVNAELILCFQIKNCLHNFCWIKGRVTWVNSLVSNYASWKQLVLHVDRGKDRRYLCHWQLPTFQFFFCNTSKNYNTQNEQNTHKPTDKGRIYTTKYYDEWSLNIYCNFS